MRKKYQLVCAALLAVGPVFAGGILTNTNQSAAFLRNLARNASMEIDAVITNPAGIAFLPDGFHFSLNGQSVYQTRTISSTFKPFSMNADGSANADGYKVFEGEASAPIVPSLMAAWKNDRWSISFSFAITGGGGKATFNEGLPSFESQVALIPELLTLQGFAADKYSLNSYMQGRQFIYGLQLGASYLVTDNFSVYAGGRMNYVSNSYYGYMRNISANPDLGAGQEMVNLNQAFTKEAGRAQEAAVQFAAAASAAEAAGNAALAQQYQEESQKYAAISAAANQTAELTADKELDCDQSGWGLTPMVGLDWKIGALNLAARYEFRTNLNIENKTKVNTTGVKDYDNGINTPHDIPSFLSLGAQYSILPTVRVMAGYHHFFDKKAGMSNGKQKHLKGGTNEYLAGAEWDLTDRFLISAGYQKTNYGVSEAYQNDMSFSISSYTIGFGGKIRINDQVAVNIGYFFTTYDEYTDRDNFVNALNITGVDVYTRTNKVFGLGVDYSF